jgi:predicted RNA methylase
VANLVAFYDVADKTVVVVGAGGGQLIEYVRSARRVIAVDRDEAAVERLAARARETGLADGFTFVTSDFLDVRPRGDVVLFEFCLHMMAEPRRALAHGAELAPEAVVIGHSPGSRWSWYAAEDKGVEAAWKAAEERHIRRSRDIEAFQHFQDYAELEARLANQGPKSLERINVLRGQTAISIPMPYRLALYKERE